MTCLAHCLFSIWHIPFSNWKEQAKLNVAVVSQCYIHTVVESAVKLVCGTGLLGYGWALVCARFVIVWKCSIRCVTTKKVLVERGVSKFKLQCNFLFFLIMRGITCVFLYELQNLLSFQHSFLTHAIFQTIQLSFLWPTSTPNTPCNMTFWQLMTTHTTLTYSSLKLPLLIPYLINFCHISMSTFALLSSVSLVELKLLTDFFIIIHKNLMSLWLLHCFL